MIQQHCSSIVLIVRTLEYCWAALYLSGDTKTREEKRPTRRHRERRRKLDGGTQSCRFFARAEGGISRFRDEVRTYMYRETRCDMRDES